MPIKVKWNKNGAYEFLIFANHTERDEKLLIYRDVLDGLKARPLKKGDIFSAVGMPKSRRNFDFEEIE